MPEWKSVEFWIAVAVAVVVKLRTSDRLTLSQAAATTIVAVGSAYVAADWVAFRINLSVPVAAALVALLAESLMRKALIFANDPRAMIEIVKEWRK